MSDKQKNILIVAMLGIVFIIGIYEIENQKGIAQLEQRVSDLESAIQE